MKKFIVLHHSLTKDSGTVSWGPIRKHHMDPTGPYKFKDIGYHFGIEEIDGLHEVLMGRMPDEPGAHCKEMNMNTLAYGVLFTGNFDIAPPGPGLLVKGVRVVRYLMRLSAIPINNVIGHREAGLMAGFNWTKGEYKSCPGRMFDLDAFRAML